MSESHQQPMSSTGQQPPQHHHHQQQHHHQPQQQNHNHDQIGNQPHLTIFLTSGSANNDQSLISPVSSGDTYQMQPAVAATAIPNESQPPSHHIIQYNHQNQVQPQPQQQHHHHQQQHHHLQDQKPPTGQESDQQDQQQQGSPVTRFKWTKEKSQVALNLVKYGCKPKLISVAVGCSLRTAQKFVETVTPKMEGETYKDYEIRRRGRKSKDVNQRLDAIREVLSKDCNKTQVEIAADLKVSNTTVCRDLKRIGASWRDKKSSGTPNNSNINTTSAINNNTHPDTNNGNNNELNNKRDKQSIKTNNKANNVDDANAVAKTRGRRRTRGQQQQQQQQLQQETINDNGESTPNEMIVENTV